ncbi:type II toxin-antitoxin system PemK/MazF family toxin [Kangiella sp. HD9-110m-PIT-SAG07]|nr:type II toxin-antitoxin system PemK/MazF family toxin [Kangiella sp. HD9-110m-PIT-SAG07]
MAIKFHPKVGQLLLCDFSVGFKEPEMVKNKRPVVVISPSMAGRQNLVTVVALSTKEPEKLLNYHYKLPKNSMPQLGRFQTSDTWLKGDMIYTVGFHRLNLILSTKETQILESGYISIIG